MIRRLLLPEGAESSAMPLLLGRALRAFADGYVAILLPAYLLTLGFGTWEVGLIASATLLGSAIRRLAQAARQSGTGIRDRRAARDRLGHARHNDFFLASQMWVAGDMYRRRCDLLCFVDGLPLVFNELKEPAVPLKSAFDDNLRDYRGQSVPQFFPRMLGTLTSAWEHFFDWKRVDD